MSITNDAGRAGSKHSIAKGLPSRRIILSRTCGAMEYLWGIGGAKRVRLSLLDQCDRAGLLARNWRLAMRHAMRSSREPKSSGTAARPACKPDSALALART